MHLRRHRAARDGHRHHRDDRGNLRQPHRLRRRHRHRRRGSYRRRHRRDGPGRRASDGVHRRAVGRRDAADDRLIRRDAAAYCLVMRPAVGHRDAGRPDAVLADGESAAPPAGRMRMGCCRRAGCGPPAWARRAPDRVAVRGSDRAGWAAEPAAALSRQQQQQRQVPRVRRGVRPVRQVWGPAPSQARPWPSRGPPSRARRCRPPWPSPGRVSNRRRFHAVAGRPGPPQWRTLI